MTTPQTPEIPTAKRHALLDIIGKELAGAHHEKVFEVLGHKYAMRTLDPQEESWADSYVRGDNFYQTARNRRAPYVAAAIQAIDGVAVETLFTFPDTASDLEAKLFSSSPEYRRAWHREQVLTWLVDRDKHGPFVQHLYQSYLEIDGQRTEALENLDPLLKTTRTGGSSNTSSLEKESSSQIPALEG